MGNTNTDKNFIYAVARIRSHELKLFTKQNLLEVASARDIQSVKKLLKEKGWGKDKDDDIKDVLISEREKLWEFIDEIVPDKSIFDVFRIKNDYHNLKAAIKESTLEHPYNGIYIDESVTDVSLIRDSIRNRMYGDLPPHLREVAKTAHEVFLQTSDGQMCDVLVDSECLKAIKEAGVKSKDRFLSMYAELVCASSNIKICVRAAKTSKDRDFIEKAVVECDTLDKRLLINASVNGIDAVCAYLQNTDYKDAVPEIKKSLSIFEKWCDNLVIDRMKTQKYESFGLGPIAAYILAKESEIKTVRIIATGKQNGFDDDIIKERVRETYV